MVSSKRVCHRKHITITSKAHYVLDVCCTAALYVGVIFRVKIAMSKHVTLIIEWKGPYSLEEVNAVPAWGDGLYLATGKLKQKQYEEIQYCGITEGSFSGRLNKHHKVHEINRNQKFWLGNVVYPEKASRHFLETAESLIIYFWQPTLNERKKIYPPKPVTLMSRWFKKDGSVRVRQHPLCKDLDDVLSWDGEYWRAGNLSVWEE